MCCVGDVGEGGGGAGAGDWSYSRRYEEVFLVRKFMT